MKWYFHRCMFVYYVTVYSMSFSKMWNPFPNLPPGTYVSGRRLGNGLHIFNVHVRLDIMRFSLVEHPWWRHQMETFSRYWPFMRGIHRFPVNSPHKGQWRGPLMLSLICGRINDWVNNHKAGDLRRNRAHYDISVMTNLDCCKFGPDCDYPCHWKNNDMCDPLDGSCPDGCDDVILGEDGYSGGPWGGYGCQFGKLCSPSGWILVIIFCFNCSLAMQNLLVASVYSWVHCTWQVSLKRFLWGCKLLRPLFLTEMNID